MVVYRKVGGLHFLSVGRFGGSFYIRRPAPVFSWVDVLARGVRMPVGFGYRFETEV